MASSAHALPPVSNVSPARATPALTAARPTPAPAHIFHPPPILTPGLFTPSPSPSTSAQTAWERRGGIRGITKSTREAQKGRRGNNVSGSVAPQAANSMPPDGDNDGAEKSGGEKPGHLRKKTRTMKPQEKLILIQECCEHPEEYRASNKTQF